MARKKQHLRYQAKKGRLQKEVGTSLESVNDKIEKGPIQTDVVNTTAKVKKKKAHSTEFTKLPASETKFVRREIIYIGFIALILVIFYLAVFLIFRYTGFDEWLSSFIKLEG